MPTYNFTFPAAAAGLNVSIKDASGDEVDTATAGSPAFPQGPIIVTAELDGGDYVAEAASPSIFFSSRAVGVLDVVASLDALAARAADIEAAATELEGRVADLENPE